MCRYYTGCQDAYLISSATRLSAFAKCFGGPVALRHQIAPALPVRRTLYSLLILSLCFSTKCNRTSQQFFSDNYIFLLFKLHKYFFNNFYHKKPITNVVHDVPCSILQTVIRSLERAQSNAMTVMRQQKKEHCHLPKMRVLLLSVLYRVPGCISHLFGNPAIRPCKMLRRTRGFASPDFSGFACSENLLNLESNQVNHCTALLNTKFTA